MIFTTKAQANQHTDYDAYAMSWVVLDATPANNGLYQKAGSGWTKVAELPYSFLRADNEGSGSANLILATNNAAVSNDQTLVIVPITHTNTSVDVIVKFNDGPGLAVKTASGGKPAIGGLIAGMIICGFIADSSFRMVSDQSSAAIQAAAEAAVTAAAAQVALAEDARHAAQAAADIAATTGAGDVPIVPSVAAAVASSFRVTRTSMLVAGKSARGDSDPQLYVRVAAQPSHGGKFRSTDRFMPEGTTSSSNGGW